LTLTITTAPQRNSRHWTATSVASWEAFITWLDLDHPATVKEAGNYVLGELRPTTVLHPKAKTPCTDLHRRKDAVVSRWALTLDADYCSRDFRTAVELALPYAAVMHPTWSHSPDAPRYRLTILLDRPAAPDEYMACCSVIMDRLGTTNFDPSTDQPERYMFRPSTQQPEWYHYVVLDGPPASVDELLAGWDPDLSTQPLPSPHRNKRDPYSLEGVIGAFNRAYEDWDLLIETYDLPYIKATEDRYQLAGAVAEAGMGPIPGTGFVYSHHANDPAYGQTCSAFDLVRLHRFGHLDEEAKPGTPINKLPSQVEMLKLAQADDRMMAKLAGFNFEAITDEDGAPVDDWLRTFDRYRTGPNLGQPKDVIGNWDLLRKHDPVFTRLYYNEMTLSPEFDDDVPWRKVTDRSRIVTSNDRWEFSDYLERVYQLRSSKARVDAQIDGASWQRVANPVKDWLEQLVWDGTARVETCLPGVRPTPYTRLVARKVMVAAVARMFDPGCKWDHALVLFGPEGRGKTWWIDKVALGFASSLGRIDNKDTLLICQRSWIVTADENHSMRKADQDAQKEFLTRTADMFRMPYDRETLIHPRHWVIWSTTNDETFLRRQQGNRRFLVVHCEDQVDFEAMTPEYIAQLWAEAVYLYRAGEKLYLTPSEAAAAAVAREPWVEEDALHGLLNDYLELEVPPDWWSRSVDSRQQWLFDYQAGFQQPGSVKMDRVCSMQLWVEAMGRRKGEASRAELLEITNTMKRMPGWRAAGRGRIPGYGPQLVFVRDDLL